MFGKIGAGTLSINISNELEKIFIADMFLRGIVKKSEQGIRDEFSSGKRAAIKHTGHLRELVFRTAECYGFMIHGKLIIRYAGV